MKSFASLLEFTIVPESTIKHW